MQTITENTASTAVASQLDSWEKLAAKVERNRVNQTVLAATKDTKIDRVTTRRLRNDPARV